MRFSQMTFLVILGICCMPFLVSAQSGLRKKADKYYQIHDYEEAIKTYLRYINRNRNEIAPKARLADSYRHMNQLEEAANWYAEVVGVTTIDPEIYFQYGQTLKGLAKYEEARKMFLKYAETNPEKGMHYASSVLHAQSKQGAPAAYKINAEFINTAAADFAPTFFKDQLVYASSRIDYSGSNRNRKEVNYPFITRRDQNNYLMKPALLHQRIKAANEGPISYSADGRWVAMTRNNFVNGKRQIPSSGLNLNLQIAEALPNGEWQNEKYFQYNGSNFSTAYPSFSADGNTLYFASNRPDGFGGWDIFVTYRVGNTWTTPENLGPTVNTQGDEIAPFFDGKDLFFSSNWHKGMGGFDVFRAAKTGGTWDRVYHLDTNINSPRDDYGFIYDETKNLGYLVSNRNGGKGNEDIYRVSKASDNIEITVLDELSMQPIVGADIDFSSCGQPTFVTDINGRHILQVPQGLNCQAVIRKNGYLASTLNVAQNQLSGAQSLQVLLRRSNGTVAGGNTTTNPTAPTNSTGYMGRVYDITSGTDVASVFVSATNQQTGATLETRTDGTGAYYLSLDPYSNYLITYSREGYYDVSRNINTGNGQERNILGSYPLRASDGTSPVVGGNTGQGSGNTGQGNTTVQPNFGSGYAVQVAAFNSSRTNDLSRFKSLGTVGNVYNRYEGNKTKVRVGVFQTRAEASAAARQVKTKGFKDAFVVTESLEGLGQEVVIADVNTNKGSGGSANVNVPAVGYKVRLAAYQKPQYFQRSKVETIGIVEQKIKGPWTIMLLSGYGSLGEAQRAAGSARAAGFPQAHVVMDNGVELTKVR
ncbi:MAG: carboxypeptidase regulatory-like domain-containing protein [Bacteroidota bacterium]